MSQLYNTSIVNQFISEYQSGNRTKSIAGLGKFVEKNPSDNIARYNLALMQSETNNVNLAINNYQKVIKNEPNHWKSKFNLYIIFIERKEFSKAIRLIDDVLRINKNYQPALRDKALVLVNLKKPDVGLNYALESLKQNSNDYIALNTLGIIYLELKNFTAAEKIFNKAIEVNPKYISSYNNIGRCYSLQNKKEKAFKFFLRVLNEDPNYLDAINNIANLFALSGQYKKSIEYYNKALKIDKNNNEILFNIGCSYFYMQEYKNAENFYKKSYKINPNNNLLQKNISILYLTLHRFKEAWQCFDGRLSIDDFKAKNNYFHNIKKILWNGEYIQKNARILVVKEQGIGDEILYGSMYGDLLKSFPNSIIETEPRLLSIFKRSFNSDHFISYGSISKNEKEVRKFDKAIYAGSLGRLFRNNINDFPQTNFLSCDSKKTKEINKKLQNLKNKKIIGISWRSKNESVGEDKSLDLETLKPILEIDECAFINIQYGDTKKEIDSFIKKTKIKIININDLDLFNDFESIAALLKKLDLFISVSNSTAHLSGALGVPTWLIKPKNHAVFHYWCQPSNKTPWYESVRLFNYTGNWDDIILNIKKKLINYFKLTS